MWVIPNVGPYHDARFRALAAAPAAQLHVVEVAARQGQYPWTRPIGAGYEKRTLFPCATEEALSSGIVAARILKAATALRPEIVVVNGYDRPYDIATAAWARLRKLVSIMVFDSTALDRPRVPWKEALKARGITALYGGVFCSGSRSREYLRSLGMPDERIAEGYDVVDNDHFAAVRKHQNAALPDEPYFLSVTRFAPEKNLLTLIDAYERYAAETAERGAEPWALVLCGSGPLDAEIRRRAARVGLGRVIFPGFLGYDALPEVYQRAGCLVLPSLSEPWGLVVNESLAAGTPVIVSERCGCAPDLVLDGEDGFVFSPERIDQLVELMVKMAEMSESERESLGRRGQEIVARYSLENWADNFLSLVDRCRMDGGRLNSRCPRSSR